MNPAEWLHRTATLSPDAPALFRGETQVADYAGFNRSAAGIGAALRARELAQGARVVVFMTNDTTYLEALYGIWYAGLVAVPVNAKLHAQEAAWIIANSGAELVLSDDAHSADLRAALGSGGPEVISHQSPTFDQFRAHPPMERPLMATADTLAWLFYTSGTTGRPKGVQIACGMITAMTLGYFVDVDTVETEDAILYAAPMSHGAGIYNFMHIIRGARHVIPESGGFEPDEILSLAKSQRNLSMFAAPTMVRRLVDAARVQGSDGDGIKTIVYGGGPMYEADILDAVEVMGPRFVQIYGQGECPMAITALPRDMVADRTHPNWRARLSSIGTAQSPVNVRILGDDGSELPRGEIGEIAVQGATVMPGYWQNPEANAKALRDGWLWTGDMGAMDDEGFVTLKDRSKDMIISGGSNIYPREVEEVLLQSPDVHEVAVVGEPHADWGEITVAFVVPRAGCAVDEATLDALCLSQIARFKRPKRYVACDDLPKNNYGKVLKTELRARLADQNNDPQARHRMTSGELDQCLADGHKLLISHVIQLCRFRHEADMTKAQQLLSKMRIPVIGSPLFIISNPDLVIAQCKAGIIGSFPSLNARPIEQLDEWLTRIKTELAAHDPANPDQPAAPYAVNLIVHKSNTRLQEDVELCVKHKVPVIICSLGAREDVYEAIHSYGGIVLHDIINQTFAHKAIEKGADGLIAVATGAGGHAGVQSPFALIQEIREWFDGPLALSGSIANGGAVLAAQAMGADFAYIGSPFIATDEANAVDAYKQGVVDGHADDIVYTNLFTGVHGNYLRPSIENAGLDPDNLPESDPSKMNFGSGGSTKAKAWKDIWGCGQGIGVIDKVGPAADYVDRLATEYEAAKARIS